MGVAWCCNNRTAAHIVKGCFFGEHIATTIDVVNSAFQIAFLDIMTIGIVGGCKPCILERQESTIVERHSIGKRPDGQCLRTSLLSGSPTILKGDILHIEVTTPVIHYCMVFIVF